MPKYQTLWLNTVQSVKNNPTDTYVFNTLPIIQIKKKSYLTVGSFCWLGPSTDNLGISVHLSGVKYNQESFYNSNSLPRLTLVAYNLQKRTIIQHDNLKIELEPQDITNLTLHIHRESDTTTSAPGGDYILNLNLEEVEDEY